MKKIVSNVILSMIPPYDVILRYIKVVVFKTAYFLVNKHFKIHWVSSEKN